MSVPTPPSPEARVNLDPKWLAILVLGGIVAWPQIKPYIPRPDPFVSLGKAYRADTAAEYAVGWEAWSGALQAGKTATEAKTALQTAYQAERVRVFNAKVSPSFARVLPPDTDPATPAQRAAAVAAGLGFAKGLRSR